MADANEWLESAYPISAAECAKNATSDLDLLKHALNKWEHFLYKKRRKYGIWIRSHHFINKWGETILDAGSHSCSLCQAYYLIDDSCDNCPLFKIRGAACYVPVEQTYSPYDYLLEFKNPGPMIALLKKAIEEYHKSNTE